MNKEYIAAVQQDFEDNVEGTSLDEISSFLSELEDCNTQAERIEILYDQLALYGRVLFQAKLVSSFIQMKSLLEILEDCEEIFAIIDQCEKVIATNPNSPPDLLVKLSGKINCLEEIGQNPALDLILLENPNFIENIFDHPFSGFFNPESVLPLWYLEKAKTSSNYELRRLVARSKYTPISFLNELSKDFHPLVRVDTISNKNTPITLLFKALFQGEFVRQHAVQILYYRLRDKVDRSYFLLTKLGE